VTKPLDRGLYELLVTADLAARLAELGEGLEPRQTDLHAAEAANRIALHLGRTIERVIESLRDEDRVGLGIRVARDLLYRLDQLIETGTVKVDAPVEPASVLRSILGLQPDGTLRNIEAPLTPLLDTTLLTNAPGEPRVGRQLQAEIGSSDRIDVLMAFIRNSGLAPIRDHLRQHCDDGRTLRILTTTYTGSTERRALDLLRDVGAQVRISYDTSSTRLHAKAWLFYRDSGFSTAYVGSSNLTHSAQVAGLEWNVRISGARNPEVIDKMGAVFESYWENKDFRPYDPLEFDERTSRQGDPGPAIYLSPVELRPEPFQERLLEQLAVSRRHGHHRNLLVSATGTGKTVMAALFYARLREELSRTRLLFVAHRKEILDQSLATFRHAMREPSFGEKWVDGLRPERFEHVFASIQSLSQADFANLPAEHYDVVIMDEFHHAAAPSYQRLLDHVRPRELLGLTATPERADALPVLQWFDDRIAAELRLWDAIDQHYLTPFLYFGIHDGLDLEEIPWKRGIGYDTEALAGLYTSSDAWAHLVIKEVDDRAEDLASMRALGFCVNVTHARFMARIFREKGIAAVAIWGNTPSAEREAALRDLATGRIKVLFSVDLFNEGIDVPTINTLLLLRPTDSPTLFLQQLGRGLRKARNKTVCTVLDFVGHHRKEFRFDRPLRALLGGTRKDLEAQVRGGFPLLPAGCHMELDPVATEIVLRSIRESIPSRWKQKVAELRALVNSGHEADLATYLQQSGLDLSDVYAGSRGWSNLCEEAGVPTQDAGPEETKLRRAAGRLLHIDDNTRLGFYLALLARETAPVVADLDERQRRLARMLVAQVADQVADKSTSLQAGIDFLWSHPQVRSELRELFAILRTNVDHLHLPLERRAEVPLEVHARYTRLEILAAFDVGAGTKVAPWQTGIRWIPEARTDLLAFTLDKTDGVFSPTTRYRDYAISRELIHWESQSVTRAESDTGIRYRHHLAQGTDVLLFARLRQNDRAFWFLGPATYVSHTGERPMAITWRLRSSLPGDLFAAFAAAVA